MGHLGFMFSAGGVRPAQEGSDSIEGSLLQEASDLVPDRVEQVNVDTELLAWARAWIRTSGEDAATARGHVISAVAAVALGDAVAPETTVPTRLYDACRQLDGQALGQLYECLLTGDTRASADRKRQGSYYTPLWLVEALLDRALEPFLRSCSSPTEVLKLRVVDPTMGAGAFLLRAAARMARRCEELTGPGPQWRARIAAQCLFGVDADPAAAKVARMALALDCPGSRPHDLSDHLVHGDALADPLPGPGRYHVVVGNPPWEKAKLLDAEYFAGRDGAVAKAVNAARRGALIAGLEESDPAVAEAYRRAADESAARMRWYRESGRYPLSSAGDVNLYALVVERVLGLLEPRGLAGLLVPSGIATDHNTSRLFGHLVRTGRLHELLDFENRDGAFPDVHREQRFCLLTLGGAGRTRGRFRCAFGLSRATAACRHPLEIDPETVARLNPRTLNLPLLRSSADLAILEQMHRVAPPCTHADGPSGGAWGLRYVRMFDMSRDSALFESEETEGSAPLYEGKMIYLYDHRHAAARTTDERAQSRSASVPVSEEAKRDPAFAPSPRYWVPRTEAQRRLPPAAWRIAFRDIANPNNERTLIAAAIPDDVACGNTLPLLCAESVDGERRACLLANLASLPLDYVVRAKAASRHANWYLVRQLPVFPPERYDDTELRRYVIDRVLALSYTSHHLAPMAVDLGQPRTPAPWTYDPDERRRLRCELDALFMALYGLDGEAIEHVLSSFDVLRRREERAHGEFLTARLIREAMAEAWTIAGRRAGCLSPGAPPRAR